MSQIEFANLMNVAASTVSSWCNGDKMPRMDKVEIIAKIFNVQTSDLIEKHEAVKENTESTIKAALWGGDKDLSQEDIDELWQDVQAYVAFKTQQRKKKK